MNENHSCCAHESHIQEYKKKFWISLILTIPVLILSTTIQELLGFSIKIPYQSSVILALASIIYFYGGYPFIKGAIQEIKKNQPGMMTLIATAITVAFFYSAATVVFKVGMDFFWELATLIDVMLLGHWIEAKSVLGASRAIEELIKVMPSVAHIIKDGQTNDIPTSQLKVGDIVLVKTGEKIPSDGIISEGESYINESMLTGESKPVHKRINDKVIGGSINTENILKVKIEKTGKETYLSQLINLVNQAQKSKSKTQDLANKAAAILFYAALSASAVTYIVWYLIGQSFFGFERSITVLVISCPHALGLAIPLVVSLSSAITAQNGILIRDRTAFEKARNIDAIFFDKTGTLTEGKFGVTDIIAYIDQDELLEIVASIENNSEHIIAKSIIDFLKSKNTQIIEISEFKSFSGKGVYAKISEKQVFIGNPVLMQELNIDISNNKIKQLQEQGKTVVFVAINGQLAGVFALADIIRKESYEAIKKLKKLNIKTYMLTGDAEPVARQVAEELGIDQYFAEVLPHEKIDKIKQIEKEGYKVAMVGDGINDAPALVASDVGIAIGAGTDVAIESADIILVRNNPVDVINIIYFSRKTYTKMVQNLWWAAGYNILAIPLAAGVLYNYGIVISPAIGAVLMSLSTIIVAINSRKL